MALEARFYGGKTFGVSLGHERPTFRRTLCLICAEKVMEQMPAADAARHFEEYLRAIAGDPETLRALGFDQPEIPA